VCYTAQARWSPGPPFRGPGPLPLFPGTWPASCDEESFRLPTHNRLLFVYISQPVNSFPSSFAKPLLVISQNVTGDPRVSEPALSRGTGRVKTRSEFAWHHEARGTGSFAARSAASISPRREQSRIRRLGIRLQCRQRRYAASKQERCEDSAHGCPLTSAPALPSVLS
jgi:hypothetical protein